jgi:hypothetical protein
LLHIGFIFKGLWSQTGAKQTPSFRVHYPKRMKISVVVVVVVVVM